MRTINILTIQDMNYGNRLQNYAMQEILKKNNYNVFSYGKVDSFSDFYLGKTSIGLKGKLKKIIKFFLSFVPGTRFYRNKKNNNKMSFYNLNKKLFDNFNKLISYRNTLEADYFIAGSDQIWNPNLFIDQYLFMLGFSSDKNKNIAIAPSIAVEDLTKVQCKDFNKYIHNFKALSCREIQGAELINNKFGEECIQLIDPTLMLSQEEWMNVERKPVMMLESKYIFVYFLGKLSQERRDKIKELAEKENMSIVDVSKTGNSSFPAGPSEFIYLIHHSELVLTDSYHALIFSYIFNKRVRVLSREENGMKSMNSRMTTLKTILNLSDKIFISNSDILHSLNDEIINDYGLLKIAQNKFNDFIKRNIV